MDAAASRELAACVLKAATVAFDPLIDRSICGPGIESDQRAACVPHRDIGHAAQI